VHREGFESRAVELLFAVGWAAFWLYWILAAFSMKKGRIAWSRELRIRVVIVVVAILLAPSELLEATASAPIRGCPPSGSSSSLSDWAWRSGRGSTSAATGAPR
jgi:hypothetical protein